MDEEKKEAIKKKLANKDFYLIKQTLKWVIIIALILIPAKKIISYAINMAYSEQIIVKRLPAHIFKSDVVASILEDVRDNKITDAIKKIEDIDQDSIPSEVYEYLTAFSEPYEYKEDKKKLKTNERVKFDFSYVKALINRSNYLMDYFNDRFNHDARSYRLAEIIPYYVITERATKKKDKDTCDLIATYLNSFAEQNITLSEKSAILLCLRFKIMYDKKEKNKAKDLAEEIEQSKDKFFPSELGETSSVQSCIAYLDSLRDQCNTKGYKWVGRFKGVPGLEDN